MNIGIYVEGGHYLGLGNVYRMISLAKSLMIGPNVRLFFITTSDHAITELIRNQGFLNVFKETDLKRIGVRVQSLNLDILIVDVLNIDADFIRTVRNKNHLRIVLFGNNNDANHSSDLVINAIISTRQFRNENYTDQYGTQYLKGPKYLTLRDEFVYQGYQYSHMLSNILLLFGGSDQANLSFRILNDLLADSRVNHLNFTVVVGAAYVDGRSLQMLKKLSNVKILRNITNVNETMLSNDFLFTSAGTAFFEGLYLGIPSVAFFQNRAQQEVFGRFFNTFEYETVHSVVDLMLDTYSDYERFCEGVRDMEVGTGKNEIIEKILNLK